MSEPAQKALAVLFARLAQHFRALARGQTPQLDDILLQNIDLAMEQVTACTAATHACVAAIVGLRRTLYPDARPYQPVQMAPSAPQTAPSEVASFT
jgi:hypothetical protein